MFNKEEIELLEEIKENRVGKWEYDAIKKSKKINVHTIRMDEEYFLLIKDGKKKYELRMNDDKRKNYKIGDEICFLKRPDMKEFFYKKIINLHYFKTLDELVEKIDVELMGFEDSDALKKVMNKFYENELGKLDVVAIELENEC